MNWHRDRLLKDLGAGAEATRWSAYSPENTLALINVQERPPVFAHWRLFADCTSAEAASKLASRHFTAAGMSPLDVTVSPYHKGGHLIACRTQHPGESWAERVVHILAVAQSTGRGWTLHGRVHEELDAWSTELKTPGLTAVHVLSAANDLADNLDSTPGPTAT